MQLNLALANCISTYSYNLRQDGISYDDVMSEIYELRSFVKTYSPSIEKADKSYKLLKKAIDSLEGKVRSTYGEE